MNWKCRRRIAWLVMLACGMAPVATRADDSPARFYRGLNLNGPPLRIDGNAWEGKEAKDYACNGAAFENQEVTLKPRCDRNRAQMIRSSRWGASIDVELSNIPSGVYQVFLYVWEDNDAERFKVLLNDRTVVEQYDSRGAGIWERLGPWKAEVKEGKIKISARGGAANLSGVEVWSGTGAVRQPGEKTAAAYADTPTADHLEFFERKIRPLLSQHCFECHSSGAKNLAGGLLLDSRAGIRKGGDTEPPVVPGDPEGSLLITAVRHEDPGLKMPPKKKLAEEEIADLEEWVKLGAPDPRTLDTTEVLKKYAIDWDKGRAFWSFQPVQSPPPPTVKNEAWPVNDVDRFILARLEQTGLSPAPVADKRTLIRRVTFDLIGLPPTPEEIDAFLTDESPMAYPRLVDRLLASAQYGPRWGRYWLDVVRYADTAGDNSDFPIPQMHKYRDWVIAAFDRDMPYDQFVREQIAGDLLPDDDAARRNQRIVATGYIANARRFGSVVKDYPQHLTIEDTIDNLGRAFLGLTVNCARCHDHKFDPISTQDYYALYGIFHSTRYPWPGIELEQKQRDLVPLVPAAEFEAAVKAQRQRQEQLTAEVQRLEKERNAAEGEKKKELEKSLEQARQAADSFSRSPLPVEQAYAVADATKIEDARVQQKGDPNKPGAVVHRRFLTVMGGTELPADVPASGRQQLADWIVNSHNPLTARVMVNRVWQYHFGKGIVSTPNDFGKQGRLPSHPELLDWLAHRFVESGWSIKALHRLIVLSRTYQLASQAASQTEALDPSNELLSFFTRRRLDAEAIRDTLLVLGGNLDSGPGGPHPFPPQAQWGFTQHNPFKAVYETNHRSVYLMTQRIQRHPYMTIFDGADPSSSTPRRQSSTTPLQALYLLNDPFVHEQSQKFATRLIAERSDDPARIERCYRLALGRPPDADEIATGVEFLKSVREALLKAGSAADQLDQGALQAFARALFRLNEFVYID